MPIPGSNQFQATTISAGDQGTMIKKVVILERPDQAIPVASSPDAPSGSSVAARVIPDRRSPTSCPWSLCRWASAF